MALIAESDKDDGTNLHHLLQPRAAQLHMTNATLRTPRGSRVIPRPQYPTEHGLTTQNLLEKACEHLITVDPKLRAVIEQNPCRVFSPEGLAETIDPFRSLVSGICGQQVSGAAAKSAQNTLRRRYNWSLISAGIKNKFVAIFNEDNEDRHVWPTPEQVAATDIARLRTAGLSQRKAEYVQGLAEKFASGELTAQLLADASDEEVMEKLIAVRGLGKWSVEMFACFALKRMDIFSTGDLGVQLVLQSKRVPSASDDWLMEACRRGMAAYVGRDVAKLKSKGGGKWKYMSEQDMLSISAKFSPYRYGHADLRGRVANH